MLEWLHEKPNLIIRPERSGYFFSECSLFEVGTGVGTPLHTWS